MKKKNRNTRLESVDWGRLPTPDGMVLEHGHGRLGTVLSVGDARVRVWWLWERAEEQIALCDLEERRIEAIPFDGTLRIKNGLAELDGIGGTTIVSAVDIEGHPGLAACYHAGKAWGMLWVGCRRTVMPYLFRTPAEALLCARLATVASVQPDFLDPSPKARREVGRWLFAGYASLPMIESLRCIKKYQ